MRGNEMSRMKAKWRDPLQWPLMLTSLTINGLRGWSGQKIDFTSPFMVISGENGVGKSTVLQAAASMYLADNEQEKAYFPSYFFPDTTWDPIRKVSIQYTVRQGAKVTEGKIDKLTNQWRNLKERKKRNVVYLDLGRMMPIRSRKESANLVKASCREISADPFSENKAKSFSSIMGRPYERVKFVLTDQHRDLWVQVVALGSEYSSFHQGTGESSVAAFLRTEIKDKSLLLIDEIESSLHPLAQRRIIHFLAELCRLKQLQIIVTTHSPYILNEFHQEDRICIIHDGNERKVLVGVSPEFAMTQMDDRVHTEIDVWVEDEEAKVFLEVIIGRVAPHLLRRCSIKPYGSCEVGKSLGTMVQEERFERPTVVYLDGDQFQSQGCQLLPGGEAPERVVFAALRTIPDWGNVHTRINRSASETTVALEKASTLPEHHGWITHAATHLVVSHQVLWHAMVSSWVAHFGDGVSEQICDRLLSELREQQLFVDPSAKNKPPEAPPVSLADLQLVITKKPVTKKPAPEQLAFAFDTDEGEANDGATAREYEPGEDREPPRYNRLDALDVMNTDYLYDS